uniref:Putative glutaredoxin n=1 Tax=viral metagenome TaxID=1070528 RepID=A0A6M3J476_9ZZZZ
MKIIVYSTKQCPRCERLKQLLKEEKIPFEEKSLDDTDVMADLHMRNAAILQAPALEIGELLFEYKGTDIL